MSSEEEQVCHRMVDYEQTVTKLWILRRPRIYRLTSVNSAILTEYGRGDKAFNPPFLISLAVEAPWCERLIHYINFLDCYILPSFIVNLPMSCHFTGPSRIYAQRMMRTDFRIIYLKNGPGVYVLDMVGLFPSISWIFRLEGHY